ncbi:MAG TPA: acetyl-CoA C-acyltransferase [Kofleriaceae bacterium]|nr:acetyl-CoA C-acyltransferase [Kofleriaceae bacterium]
MSSARVAIVAGLRTPFAKRLGGLAGRSSLELGVGCVRELLARTGLAKEIERVVFGQVVPSLHAPNVARELVLDAGLPPTVDAHSVSAGCVTSYIAAIELARAIAAGDVDAGICGGTDSVSDVPIAVSKPLAKALVANRRAKGLTDRVRAFASLSPGDLRVEPPTLVERTTGLTMGEHAEVMGQKAAVGRMEQDELAARSHQRAAAAWDDGRLAEEVMVWDGVHDECVRGRLTAKELATLRPLHGRGGTVTAGNASPLSDGASAAILMREDKARALGVPVLAVIKAAATSAVDPADELLIAPVTALPRALDRAGVTLRDLALLDLHEAFAAQVLAVTRALESRAWAERLGRAEPVGKVDWERTNVSGGSIALGHPFAATGTRQLTQVARELGRRGGGVAALAACAAGGLGAAIVIERVL